MPPTVTAGLVTAMGRQHRVAEAAMVTAARMRNAGASAVAASRACEDESGATALLRAASHLRDAAGGLELCAATLLAGACLVNATLGAEDEYPPAS